MKYVRSTEELEVEMKVKVEKVSAEKELRRHELSEIEVAGCSEVEVQNVPNVVRLKQEAGLFAS